MFGVAGVIHIGVISHHISVGISLFRFGRVGIAVAVDNITKLVLGMVLGSNNTLRFDKYFMFSSSLLICTDYVHQFLFFRSQYSTERGVKYLNLEDD